MPPVRLNRAEQQAVTRKRLLEAAEVVFSRQGYGGASVDLIAAEAGYSKGAVYSNFPNKEAIFLDLLRLYMERDAAELERIVNLKPQKLFSGVAQWLKSMHAESDCPLLATELQLHARRSPEFAEQYYELQNRQARTLGKVLTAYFKASNATMPINATDLANALTALAHGLSLQRPAAPANSPNYAGRIVEEFLKILITCGEQE